MTFFSAMITALQAQTPLKTVEDRVAEFGEVVRQRIEPKFEAAGVPYPPKRLVFIAIKKDRVLEVYAAGENDEMRFVSTYPVLAASGELGPKLREGDRQVPEGVYRVWELNPNSNYHLSLWVGYPRAFDLARSAEEGRTEPGGEIMIHGGEASRGCLAIGDEAAEDVFILAALTGVENITVVLSPIDFRKDSLGEMPAGAPPWTCEVYEELQTELARYPITR